MNWHKQILTRTIKEESNLRTRSTYANKNQRHHHPHQEIL